MSEGVLRLTITGGLFLILALLEILKPRRRRTHSLALRWTGNLGTVIFNTLLIRLLMPVLPFTVAIWARQQGIGVFSVLPVPFGINVIITILLMDLMIYWQHRIFHRIPLLWRFHSMHHMDRDLDASSALRFHFVEILLSTLLKIVFVLLLGAAPEGVIAFEAILNGLAMFNHANIRIPLKIDRILRVFVVTPDFHRVHHSEIFRENDSNFGFNLSLWDHLFKSYRAQPQKGHLGMTLGLKGYEDPKYMSFPVMQGIPFFKKG